MDLKEVQIWNIKYNLLSLDEIISIVVRWINEGRKGIHLTAVDACVSVLAQKDELVRRAILESDIVNVDSYLPARMLAKRGYDIKGRVPAPEIMEAFLKDADSNKRKVFFLGAKEDTLLALTRILSEDYPNLVIAGYRNGYFSDEEEDEIAKQISKASPDYLFIGMPSPKKERFILKYKSVIDAKVMFGVGGALDARAKVLKRPRGFLGEHGLEGFFRIMRRPLVYGNRIGLLCDFIKMASKNERQYN